MRPTVGWMESRFDFYNNYYFRGCLKKPSFETTELSDEFGHYESFVDFSSLTRKVRFIHKRGILSLSRFYNRPESELISTLLHEMTHEYVYEVLKKVPRNEHGTEFQSIANKLNEDGWNICESHAAIIGD